MNDLTSRRGQFGLLTLMAACMLAVGWVRSFGFVDIVCVPFARTNTILVSGEQKWALIQTGSLDLEAPWRSNHQWIDGVKLVQSPNKWSGYHWIVEKSGKVSIFRNDDDNAPLAMTPYWSIVIPLTLLSAVLLFSKPRQKPISPPPDRHS
ncbi:hypothetical protein [Schlesneria paludicola]|uniref:hypothetical protein n=1 Tax=Schlesneria paludicola TaxID=360056 RepID=UPI00029A6EEA|nr:hypothetical protein [Schlesneria paludicola]